MSVLAAPVFASGPRPFAVVDGWAADLAAVIVILGLASIAEDVVIRVVGSGSWLGAWGSISGDLDVGVVRADELLAHLLRGLLRDVDDGGELVETYADGQLIDETIVEVVQSGV